MEKWIKIWFQGQAVFFFFLLNHVNEHNTVCIVIDHVALRTFCSTPAANFRSNLAKRHLFDDGVGRIEMRAQFGIHYHSVSSYQKTEFDSI